MAQSNSEGYDLNTHGVLLLKGASPELAALQTTA